MANVFKANSRGVKFAAFWKLISEKRIPFDITSGTPSMVVLVVSQVTRAAMLGRKDVTSAPRPTLPTMKQGAARG